MINYETVLQNNVQIITKKKNPSNDFDKTSDTLGRPEKSDHQSKTYLLIYFETKCFYNLGGLKKGIHINGFGYVMRPIILLYSDTQPNVLVMF